MLLSWFLAVSVTSLVIILVVATRFISLDTRAGTRAAIVAIAVGFFAGGLFAGLRAREAPILHGTAIGFFSLVAWFVLNMASAIAFPGLGWEALTPELAVSVILLQIVASVLGARMGVRRVQR